MKIKPGLFKISTSGLSGVISTGVSWAMWRTGAMSTEEALQFAAVVTPSVMAVVFYFIPEEYFLDDSTEE